MSKSKALKVIAGAPDRPLVIGDIEIPCYVLEDETRVLAQRGMVAALGMARGGSSHGGGDRLAHFVNQKTLKPFISDELIAVTTNPVKFWIPRGSHANAYPATLLADLCDVVIDARNADALQKQQMHIAVRCEILIRGFARIGIIGLVDEATGYQEVRAKRALAAILEKFIADELQPWTKTFPYEFYSEIFRLKGWPGPDGVKRPSVIGHYTNDIVYARLERGVLDELKQRNPTVALGRRRNTHHQWLTGDIGHPKLREHLIGVMAIMRAASNWDGFRRALARAFPKTVGEPAACTGRRRMTSKVIAGMIAATLTLTLTAPASEATDPLSVLNAAVLDWCDAQGGTFRLPSVSTPGCEIGNALWAGTLHGFLGEADAAWWWDKRAGLPPSHPFGVLWFVGPRPQGIFASRRRGAICQCLPAIAALNNPARVPVTLIGPGATACVEQQE